MTWFLGVIDFCILPIAVIGGFLGFLWEAYWDWCEMEESYFLMWLGLIVLGVVLLPLVLVFGPPVLWCTYRQYGPDEFSESWLFRWCKRRCSRIAKKLDQWCLLLMGRLNDWVFVLGRRPIGFKLPFEWIAFWACYIFTLPLLLWGKFRSLGSERPHLVFNDEGVSDPAMIEEPTNWQEEGF